MSKIQNAVIESCIITNDDHGVLSAWLFVDYGGYGQGFGGHALYLPDSFKHSKGQRNFAGHFIFRCLDVAGVSEWSKIKGRAIRVRLSGDGGVGETVEAIGHIIKDDWFCPSDDFKAMEND